MRLLRLPPSLWLLLSLSLASCGGPNSPCASGQTQCGADCVDLMTATAHCGACGVACRAGDVCVKGQCASTCSGTLCGARCTDLMRDPNNCGACGHSCNGELCVNGSCGCGQGMSACNGLCVNLQSDAQNCGGCGHVCRMGSCQSGSCVCPAGWQSCDGGCVDIGSDASNCGGCGLACGAGNVCLSGSCVAAAATNSKIHHTLIIIQENHTFDAYFGRYCTAPTDSNPTCTQGPGCCEAAPATDPSGAAPVALDDHENASEDHNHTQACELTEIDNGLMDHYTSGSTVGDCSKPTNFAIAPDDLMATYHGYAASYALADRYFQPIVGQSSSNDMYFARAQYVFTDNDLVPEAIGKGCAFWFYKSGSTLNDPTIADLLIEHGNSFAFYAEGYAAMKQALLCPEAPPDCTSPLSLIYGGTCNYDPSDVPFEYYMNFVDNPTYMKDLGDLANDIAAGTLPDVTFVKGLAYHSEHPNNGTTVSNGVQFVSTVVDQILQSPYAADTLILLTWDEGGGFFDHVAPPQQPGADGKPYGTRIPLLAIGPFARSNEVSHVVMEHSSIVKFIEWNYLGATGQLGGRDAVVNNLGSLLDPAMTGTAVPQ